MAASEVAMQSPYVPSTSVTNGRACFRCNRHIIRGSPMSRVLNNVPRFAIFLAGVAAAAITLPRRDRRGADSAIPDEWKRSLEALEARVQVREAADAERFIKSENRLDEVETR